jgi:hypothetical protein
MARFTFGGTAGDFVFATNSDLFLKVAPSAVLTFWSAQTGGTQYTDLILNGSPATTITATLVGQVPVFSGPDGITQMWVSADGGPRVLAYSPVAASTFSQLPATADKVVYVSNRGNDSNDGSTWKSALLTVQAAVTALGGPGVIQLGQGSITTGTTIAIPSGVTVRGMAAPTAGSTPATSITYTGTGSGSFITANSTVGVVLENLMILYSSSSFTGRLVDLRDGGSGNTAFALVRDCFLGGSLRDPYRRLSRGRVQHPQHPVRAVPVPVGRELRHPRQELLHRHVRGRHGLGVLLQRQHDRAHPQPRRRLVDRRLHVGAAALRGRGCGGVHSELRHQRAGDHGRLVRGHRRRRWWYPVRPDRQQHRDRLHPDRWQHRVDGCEVPQHLRRRADRSDCGGEVRRHRDGYRLRGHRAGELRLLPVLVRRHGGTPISGGNSYPTSFDINGSLQVLGLRNRSTTDGRVPIRFQGDRTSSYNYDLGMDLDGVANKRFGVRDQTRSGTPWAWFVTSGGSTVTGSGTADLATSSTDGFTYIPTTNGTPTGAPTAITGTVPMMYDRSTNKLYVYNGAWKSVTLT